MSPPSSAARSARIRLAMGAARCGQRTASVTLRGWPNGAAKHADAAHRLKTSAVGRSKAAVLR